MHCTALPCVALPHRPFRETVGKVLRHPASAPDTTKVWFDCLAINQHAATPEELAHFAAVIHSPGTLATLVCLDQAATALGRIWCLHEVDHTFRAGDEKLVMLTEGAMGCGA